MDLAPLANPPYYAVIFTTLRTADDDGYAAMADTMELLARAQPGYLGLDSARSGVGITVSYWRTLEEIQLWKANVDHAAARELGRAKWYSHFTLRVARIEYEYDFSAQSPA
jgi:heme-degrading monooxygenase HmoA